VELGLVTHRAKSHRQEIAKIGGEDINMTTGTTDAQVRAGIVLAKAGKRSEAREILAQAVRDNPRSVLGWLWLASVVETKDQQSFCLEKVLQLNPQNDVVRRALTQLKISAPSAAVGSQYFIGHQLVCEDKADITRAIAHVFGRSGYELCCAGGSTDEDGEGQSHLFQTCQQIFLSSFSIIDLSPSNPSGYVELGIALGLNRPVIALANAKSALPSALGERHVIVYTDPADLEAKLSDLHDQGFPPTTRPTPDHCYFCGQMCTSMSTPPDETSYLVLSESRMLWRGLMRSLGPHLAKYDLHPTYLTDLASGPMLCDLRRKVVASQFALCHLGSLARENSYLALGMAIGSRVPWVLLSKEDEDTAPSILQGFERIEYSSLPDLEGRLTETLGTFLARLMPQSVPIQDRTAMLTLPFWIQLEDWINRVKHATQEPEAIQGRIRLIAYDGQQTMLDISVPQKGLLFGRDPGCDVVLSAPSVSAQHFRISRSRSGNCFVKDLNSKNGTFLNGTRLAPGEQAEIRPNDTIRVPGTQFLIWDDRPLPAEKTAPILTDTDQLPPILKIDIPDVPPPTYLSTWDHSLVLTVSLPDGRTRSMLEVQAYYPMGRILSQLAQVLHLPAREYSFKLDDRMIGDNETPLSAGIQKTDVLVMVPRRAEASRITSDR
jgi:hypothetical protein